MLSENYIRPCFSSQALEERHLQHLLSSGISLEVIKERGYRSTAGGAELLELGFSCEQARLSGILIPLYSPLGGKPLWQLRPDEPRREVKGNKVKIRKYELAPFSENRLDAHPRIQPQLKNVSITLWITEGVKKADALISAGECAVALIGVWNFKGKSRDPLANGSSVLLADFDAIAFNGRTVYIAFDSDVMRKAPVQQALARLTAILRQRGAHVFHVYLPDKPNGEKQGVDDFLAAGISLTRSSQTAITRSSWQSRCAARRSGCRRGAGCCGRGLTGSAIPTARACSLLPESSFPNTTLSARCRHPTTKSASGSVSTPSAPTRDTTLKRSRAGQGRSAR
jgi:hypothetical protein